MMMMMMMVPIVLDEGERGQASQQNESDRIIITGRFNPLMQDAIVCVRTISQELSYEASFSQCHVLTNLFVSRMS